jgi:hypothetical protein
MKTKQTAIELFSNKAHELFEQYSEGKFDRITLNKLMLKATKQSKAIEKTQLISCYVIADCRCNKEYAINEAEKYYNETYGGNK